MKKLNIRRNGVHLLAAVVLLLFAAVMIAGKINSSLIVITVVTMLAIAHLAITRERDNAIFWWTVVGIEGGVILTVCQIARVASLSTPQLVFNIAIAVVIVIFLIVSVVKQTRAGEWGFLARYNALRYWIALILILRLLRQFRYIFDEDLKSMLNDRIDSFILLISITAMLALVDMASAVNKDDAICWWTFVGAIFGVGVAVFSFMLGIWVGGIICAAGAVVLLVLSARLYKMIKPAMDETHNLENTQQ